MEGLSKSPVENLENSYIKTKNIIGGRLVVSTAFELPGRLQKSLFIGLKQAPPEESEG